MFCCHFSFTFVPCNGCFQVFSMAKLSGLYSISCRYFPFRPFHWGSATGVQNDVTSLVITIQFWPLSSKCCFFIFSLFSIHDRECTQVCSRCTGMLWSYLLSTNAWSPVNRFELMYNPLIGKSKVDLLFFPQELRSGLPNDPASISVFSMRRPTNSKSKYIYVMAVTWKSEDGIELAPLLRH